MQVFYSLFSCFDWAVTRHTFNLSRGLLNIENLIQSWWYPCHKSELVRQHERGCKHVKQKPILKVLHSEQRNGPWKCPWLLIIVDEQELVAQERHQVKYEPIHVQDRHTTWIQLDDEHCWHQPWVRLFSLEPFSGVQKLKILLDPDLWVWLVTVLVFRVLFQVHFPFSVN